MAPEAPPEAERSRASGRLSSPQAAFASWCFLIWRRTERAALQPSELFCISTLLAFSYCIQGRGRSKAPRPHWLCPCAVTSELCGVFRAFGPGSEQHRGAVTGGCGAPAPSTPPWSIAQHFWGQIVVLEEKHPSCNGPEAAPTSPSRPDGEGATFSLSVPMPPSWAWWCLSELLALPHPSL